MSSQTNFIADAESPKEQSKLFHKDFNLVVIGQIISLFGNAILRFALPLYILQESGSAALFGLVSACAFIPMIVLSPIGGTIADRVNKQRIMVVLDFFTALIIMAFIVASGYFSVVPLVIVFLMLLYGIQGAYTPAVQASLPLLANGENIVRANAIVSLVTNLSGILGPAIGGMLFGRYGLYPILIVGFGCFVFSAVMELFIKIPHRRQVSTGGIFEIAKNDLALSMRFILKEKPIMAKLIGIIFSFNLFMGAMLNVGIPVIITQILGMSNELYGISQGFLSAGALIGGLMVGVIAKKLKIQQSYLFLVVCAIGFIPIAISLLLDVSAFISYIVVTAMCFFMTASYTLFSVQLMAFVQMQTPAEIVGKVIAWLLALVICAQPIGQALYGLLFENLAGLPWAIVFGAALISGIIAVFAKATFNKLR